VINLFRDLPPRADEEVFTDVLAREGVRIERIVSTGQSTPADKPYDQEHDEWVLLLAGSLDRGRRGARSSSGRPCPDRRRHRVTRTAKGEPTIWLAVHFC
jgi:cupin 2 domain-containing protein